MKYILTCILPIVFSSYTFAQGALSAQTGEILFEGFDPVSYRSGNPQKGEERFIFSLENRKILFTSKENLTRFKANSARFLPAYGGWCALAMSNGAFLIPDYSLFKIQDDRLLFFSRKTSINPVAEWEKNPQYNMYTADIYYLKYFPDLEK